MNTYLVTVAGRHRIITNASSPRNAIEIIANHLLCPTRILTVEEIHD